jgi:hypothetical protein
MEQKIHFLKNELVPAIAAIPADVKPLWGKMNLQQMTEHMAREGFRISSGQLKFDLVMPAEQIPKMQAFLRSDKPFRENTPNALMPAEPAPVVHAGLPGALAALQAEIDYFFDVYEQDPGMVVSHPFFGELDFDLNILLLYKHSLHHLRQFGISQFAPGVLNHPAL